MTKLIRVYISTPVAEDFRRRAEDPVKARTYAGYPTTEGWFEISEVQARRILEDASMNYLLIDRRRRSRLKSAYLGLAAQIERNLKAAKATSPEDVAVLSLRVTILRWVRGL